MPIVGFTYTKINVEKKTNLEPGKDKLVNNVNLIKIEDDDRGLSKGNGLLNFYFEFNIEYGKAGKLQLHGVVLYMGTEEETKKIKKEWEKDRKMDAKLSTEIFNTILFKCNIKSLQLADDLNLPVHFKIPMLRQKPEDMIKKQELKKAS